MKKALSVMCAFLFGLGLGFTVEFRLPTADAAKSSAPTTLVPAPQQRIKTMDLYLYTASKGGKEGAYYVPPGGNQEYLIDTGLSSAVKVVWWAPYDYMDEITQFKKIEVVPHEGKYVKLLVEGKKKSMSDASRNLTIRMFLLYEE